MKLSMKRKSYGDRVVSRFILFPKRLRDYNSMGWEFRWFEKAQIVQKYNKEAFLHWEDSYWAN